MSIIDTLITDRTSQDVEELRSILLSEETPDGFDLSKHKGAYNFTDYNRVLEATRYIAQRLESLGYNTKQIGLPSLATYVDIPDEQSTSGLLEALALFKGMLKAVELPSIPSSFNYLTYQEANNIERFLVEAENAVCLVENAWFYSNDIYGGEI